MRYEAGQEIYGRLDSAPCVLRDGRFRGLLRMRNFLNGYQILILLLRSAQRARLEGRKVVMQPFVSILRPALRGSALRLLNIDGDGQGDLI